jgi:hypothetical protein
VLEVSMLSANECNYDVLMIITKPLAIIHFPFLAHGSLNQSINDSLA